METMSSEEKINEISQQLFESLSKTGDSLDKRNLLILICDTIDSDNNIGSDPEDFEKFVDKYLSGDGLSGQAADPGPQSAPTLSEQEIRNFVSKFMEDRILYLKNQMSAAAEVEQHAIQFSELLNSKKK